MEKIKALPKLVASFAGKAKDWIISRFSRSDGTENGNKPVSKKDSKDRTKKETSGPTLKEPVGKWFTDIRHKFRPFKTEEGVWRWTLIKSPIGFDVRDGWNLGWRRKDGNIHAWQSVRLDVTDIVEMMLAAWILSAALTQLTGPSFYPLDIYIQQIIKLAAIVAINIWFDNGDGAKAESRFYVLLLGIALLPMLGIRYMDMENDGILEIVDIREMFSWAFLICGVSVYLFHFVLRPLNSMMKRSYEDNSLLGKPYGLWVESIRPRLANSGQVLVTIFNSVDDTGEGQVSKTFEDKRPEPEEETNADDSEKNGVGKEETPKQKADRILSDAIVDKNLKPIQDLVADKKSGHGGFMKVYLAVAGYIKEQGEKYETGNKAAEEIGILFDDIMSSAAATV